MSFSTRYNELDEAVTLAIKRQVLAKGVESHHSNETVLKVHNADLMFNLQNGAYLKEVGSERLIDNSGNEYFFSVLSLEKLCEIADHFKCNDEDFFW